MSLRLLSNLFFVLGVLLLGAAAYDYFLNRPDEPGARVAEPDREFPDLVVGVNHVKFALENPTRHPVRVVGYQFC